MQSLDHPLARDLDEVLDRTRALWNELRDGRVFITGGSGFFGVWLLESFLWANQRCALGARAVVLSRSPQAVADKHPRLARAPGIEWHQGDVRTFAFPAGAFSHVIHAATDASRRRLEYEPIDTASTILDGTRHLLDFATSRGIGKVLFTSSGAVYGPQPPNLERVPESFAGAPDTMELGSAYAESKRAAEMLCALYRKEHGILPVIARCFAFAGPHLPLDQGYAIGNFVRDALAGGPVLVASDGLAWRSYLYAGDLAAWLWTLLFRGEPCRPYNVGSGTAITVGELARLVASLCGSSIDVVIAKTPAPGTVGQRYVPDVDRARVELGLEAWTHLPEAIRRMLAWRG